MIDITSNASAIGILKITDKITGRVIREKQNAIHFANLSAIIARALAGQSAGHMRYFCLGNGGSSVTPSGTIFYKSTNAGNIYDLTADLYNQTYQKDLLLNPNDDQNNITVRLSNANYADIVLTCTLDFGEPAGQNVTDSAASLDEEFVFDEIGIKSNDSTGEPSLLLTHVIFSPIEKSLTRVFEIEYVVRIQMG